MLLWLALLSRPTATAAAGWAGPSKLIFAADQCAKTGTNTTASSPAECEAACEASAHCNAVNYNTGPHAVGGRCNLHCCAKAVSPSWAVEFWISYSDFTARPACVPPPPPPAPPPAPGAGALVKLTAAVTSHGARCLDGSPAAYYFTPGTGSGADKWVVYLNGGGWCWSESEEYSDVSQSCWGRSGSGLGTSNGLAPHRSAVMGADTPMANWNQANVIYCDGGSFSGNREDPVDTPQYRWPNGSTSGPVKTLWYRGSRNLDAIVDDLKVKGMGNASLAVLGGCSAGGMAALSQCNHFAARAGVPSKCVGDAGEDTYLHACCCASASLAPQSPTPSLPASLFARVVSIPSLHSSLSSATRALTHHRLLR
jgi:hypothetical protein